MAVDSGFFGYDKLMNDLYGFEPGKEDEEGRAIKRNFQANMVQSGFDAALAESMAHTQSGIAQSNMTHAADLEQRNTAANMAQEFNYNTQSMSQQFELQDKFADNQNERDIGMLAATGEQTRLSQNNQGIQERQSMITKGEQDRKAIKTTGNQERKLTAAKGEEDRKTIGYTDQVAANRENRQAARSRSMARAF